MAKSKLRKQTSRPPIAANDPTPERMAKDDFAVIKAERREGEQLGVNGIATTAYRVVNPLVRLHRLGWFDDDGLRALLGYQTLMETVGRDKGKSSLDFTGGGGDGSTVEQYHRHISRCDRLTAIDFALSLAIEPRGVTFLRAVVGPYGRETVCDVAERMRADLSRDGRRTWAQDVFTVAAVELVGIARDA